jgi:hypothetical protein
LPGPAAKSTGAYGQDRTLQVALREAQAPASHGAWIGGYGNLDRWI